MEQTVAAQLGLHLSLPGLSLCSPCLIFLWDKWRINASGTLKVSDFELSTLSQQGHVSKFAFSDKQVGENDILMAITENSLIFKA
jgi:hypothetical protein